MLSRGITEEWQAGDAPAPQQRTASRRTMRFQAFDGFRKWAPHAAAVLMILGHSRCVLGLERDIVYALAFSPDCTVLVAGRSIQVSDTRIRGTLEFWSTTGWTLSRSVALESGIDAVAFDRSGRFLFVATLDQSVQLWDVDGANFVASWKSVGFIGDLLLSPTGEWLATIAPGKVDVWDVRALPTVRMVESVPGTCAAFSRDGRKVVVGAGNSTILRVLRLPGLREESLVRIPNAIRGPEVAAASFETGLLGMVTSAPRQLHVFEIETGAFTSWPIEDRNVEALAFSPGSQLLVAGQSYARLNVWDWRTGKQLLERVQRPSVRALAMSPHREILAASGGVFEPWEGEPAPNASIFIRGLRDGEIEVELLSPIVKARSRLIATILVTLLITVMVGMGGFIAFRRRRRPSPTK